jgi:SSS family solute:Na+ symporter
VARNGILISVLFWFLFDAMTAFAGLYARAILPPLDRPMMAFPLLAEALLPPGMKGLFVIGMLATVMSTLNSLLFVSATTLGRDLYWRWRGGLDPVHEIRLTRLGLLATGLAAVVLAEAVPSVVRLWYVIGTAVVPGLLLPVVAGYFGSIRPDPATALRILVVAPVVSTGWLLTGWSTSAPGVPLLGIEPMFPGLLVALGLWGWGRKRKQGRGLDGRVPAREGS